MDEQDIAAAVTFKTKPRFEILSISLVAHPYHGPWSYADGICRGCGVGFLEVKELDDSQDPGSSNH